MEREGVSIKINDLNKRYRGAEVNSLTNVDLKITAGDKFGIIGPNGAGKTTLISILCGVLEASSGTVEYSRDGVVLGAKERQSIIGFVPQEYAFYEELTALQNLAYFGALYNLKKKELEQRSQMLLEFLGLKGHGNKKVKTFSGGMKRRVNLAIGILHEPKILFLDEPTVGVDVQSKHAIVKFLNQLNEQGTTIIYTSHHLAEAEELCNRIALIDHGKVIAQNETKGLLKENSAENLEELVIQLTGGEYRDSNV